MFFFSCSKKNKEQRIKKYLPKGYYRIDLPEKEYEKKCFEFKNSSFCFDIPKYLDITETPKEKTEGNIYQIVLTNAKHNFAITLVYQKIKNNFNELSYLTINQLKNPRINNGYTPILIDKNKKSIIGEIQGGVPMPIIFHLSDMENHFLQGAMHTCFLPELYSKEKNCENIDSLKPIIDFFKKDIFRIRNSIEWSITEIPEN